MMESVAAVACRCIELDRIVSHRVVNRCQRLAKMMLDAETCLVLTNAASMDVKSDQMLLNDSLLAECRRFGSWRSQQANGC